MLFTMNIMNHFKRFAKDVALLSAGLVGIAVSAGAGAIFIAWLLAWTCLRRRWFWIFTAIVSGLALLAIIFSACVIWGYSSGRTYDSVDSIPHRKVALVLGCSEKLPSGRDNWYFTSRIKAAADLYKAGKVDFFIVSGDNHKMSYNEPQAMKRALYEAGVPRNRVTYDFAGFRTLDSVVRAKTIFSQDEITIISQKFHNQRAIFIASQNGIDAIGYNAADPARSKKVILREMLARVKTVLDAWLLRTKPKFEGPKIDIGSKK